MIAAPGIVTLVSRRSQSDLLNQRWTLVEPVETTVTAPGIVTMVSRRSQSDLLNQRWRSAAL
jgi:hypothetical protein